MFIIDENGKYAIKYDNIISLSVVNFPNEYAVKAETPDEAIILVRFKSKPRLDAIISSMWYANIRGAAKWQYNDPT